MAANRHQDGQDGSRQQPPFLPSFIQAQAQNKEEDTDGAHIHRTGGKRLRAPIERQVFGSFLQVLLSSLAQQLDGGRFLRIHRPGRRSAVEIGDHQVGQFFPAVAPGGGILQVQTFAASFVLVLR